MKKVFKWVGILFLAILVLLLMLLFVFFVRNRMFIESSDKEIVEYLNNNKIVLNKEAFQESSNLFDPETYESKIILLGEVHGFASVQTIDKELFLHLNKKTGLRYYVAEMDSIRAKQLNTFLGGEIKDTLLLKQTVIDIRKRILQQSSLELYQKWSDIYDYNKTLPDSLKLVVVGVDTDFDEKSSIPRDEAMLNNFNSFVKDNGLEGEQFYGLFGLFHVLQNEVNQNNHKYQSFASLLKSEGLKVSSIVCFNVDSEIYLPKNDFYPTTPTEKLNVINTDGPIMLVKGVNDLKESSKDGNETLFYLSGKNSPYFKSHKLLKIKTNFLNQNCSPYNEKLSTVDFFQYAILIRNSKALSSIN